MSPTHATAWIVPKASPEALSGFTIRLLSLTPPALNGARKDVPEECEWRQLQQAHDLHMQVAQPLT